MRGSLALPGWARTHFTFVLGLTIIVAVILRTAPSDSEPDPLAAARHYTPVATAIGIAQDMPTDDTLATWVNSGLYRISLTALSRTYPEASPVDFGAAFLSAPDDFSALARFASLVATAISICFIYLLISQLLDRVAGVAAAFIFAVHPAAVQFTAGVNSGAFALLFLLCGLLVAMRIDWGSARTAEFGTVGFALGLAFEGLPIAAPLFVLTIIVAVRSIRSDGRAHIARHLAVATACFAAAAAAVFPSAVPPAEILQIVAVSVLAVGGILLAGRALRALRQTLDPPVYSSVVLSIGLAVGIITLVGFDSQSPGHPSDASADATEWMRGHTPADSVVLVHPELAESIVLPRNERCWVREYSRLQSAPEASRRYALAAAQAASRLPGPRFEVIVANPSETLVSTDGRSLHPGEVHYVVVPDHISPHLASARDVWFVARFRSPDADCPGVTIWGTQASPSATPVHVEWRQRRGHFIASATTAE